MTGLPQLQPLKLLVFAKQSFSMHDAVNLVSLPNELLEQILNAVQNKASLAAAARTCHALRDIAEARLYSHFIFEKPEALADLENTTRERPKRGGFVRRLDLLFGTAVYDDRLGDNATADTVAALFPRLESLTLEYPLYGSEALDFPGWFAEKPAVDIELYEKLFWSASLLNEPSCKDGPFHNLRSLKLCWTRRGMRDWVTTPACPAFLLPNLERLELCFVIVKGINHNADPIEKIDQKLAHFVGKTSLKTLIFKNSHVHRDALDMLLKFPKALVRLELNEKVNSSYLARSELRLSVNSLRHLALDSSQGLDQKYPRDESIPQFRVDLSGLPSLESLQLGPYGNPEQNRWELRGTLPRNLSLIGLTGFHMMSLFRPPLDIALSDLRMGELFANREGKRLALVFDLSFPCKKKFSSVINGHIYRYDARNLIRDLRRRLQELRSECVRGDFGGASSPLAFTAARHHHPDDKEEDEAEKESFDIFVTTAKPISREDDHRHLHHPKEPVKVVRYEYSSSRPGDGEEFLERPYFESTGLPEDEADLEDQHPEAIEMFALEKLS